MESRILLVGIGNCGRADDGLGWAFIDKIQSSLPENYDFEYRYQLQIEDAELASKYKTVIFIDAHKDSFEKGFVWKECFPQATASFTTHELAPESVLCLTDSIYAKQPKALILGITGVNFCLSIGLSGAAVQNLSNALNSFILRMHLQPIKTIT